MSPGSKKSKKLATRAAKEPSEVPSKSTNLHANGGKSAPTSAYNPGLSTCHPIEISTSVPVLTTQKNDQLIIDETEEQSLSSPGTGVDYDSLSNNDSCSGESEDHKEKATTSVTALRSDSISVPGSDADKRDKIRQKNERKHQRQKEKRAQELHMRCCRYLTSCKLEALAQQLATMGFSSEQATMALIASEGRMEESVAWLLQESEHSSEHVKPNPEDRAHIKLDISEELAKIADLEKTYKCSKQEVERVVVACEGDLAKAETNLKVQKQELAAAAPAGKPKVEGAGVSSRGIDKIGTNSSQNSMMKIQGKGAPSFINQQQQRMDERDLNYTTAAVTGIMFQESVDGNLQSLRTQQLPTWVRAQVAAAAAIENLWPSKSSSPSVSNPLQPILQFPMPSARLDSQYLTNREVKANMRAESLRENFVMQHSPSIFNTKQSSTSTSGRVSPPTEWYMNGISNLEMIASNVNVAHNLQNTGLSDSSPPQFYHRSHTQSFVSNPLDSASARQSGSWNLTGKSLVSPFTSASLAAPASLGLFSGWGSLGSTDTVDWSSDGSFTQRDYSSIDWSLDLTELRTSVTDTWSTMMTGEKARASPVMNGVYIPGLQDSSSVMAKASASAASRERTTPFAGKDLFGVPRRQFVASPL